jgi:hypothetical protein
MRKEALDNLTKGRSPSLHAADPNWDILKGVVERQKVSQIREEAKTVAFPTRAAVRGFSGRAISGKRASHNLGSRSADAGACVAIEWPN